MESKKATGKTFLKIDQYEQDILLAKKQKPTLSLGFLVSKFDFYKANLFDWLGIFKFSTSGYLVMKSTACEHHWDVVSPLRFVLKPGTAVLICVNTSWKSHQTIRELSPSLMNKWREFYGEKLFTKSIIEIISWTTLAAEWQQTWRAFLRSL